MVLVLGAFIFFAMGFGLWFSARNTYARLCPGGSRRPEWRQMEDAVLAIEIYPAMFFGWVMMLPFFAFAAAAHYGFAPPEWLSRPAGWLAILAFVQVLSVLALREPKLLVPSRYESLEDVPSVLRKLFRV